MENQNKAKILSVFVVGLVIGLAVATGMDKTPQVSSNPDEIAPMGAVPFENAVANVAKAVGPAVVSIHTEKTEKVQYRRRFSGSPFNDDVFDKFFEDFFGEIPDQVYKQQGLGSGVIINPQGYILTNEHVIEDTDKITVTLPDGREFKGVLKGTDPRADLAVVKIDAPNLPVAKLGDSDNVKIGEWVVAIGNPFGNLISTPEPTVTAGVIGALHRSLPPTSRRDSNYSDLIQTDAAINPGNSGGPLINLKGEVIGINVALFSTTGGYQGIGFAIPVNTAKRIVSSLIEGKEVQYGWIGVSVQNINQSLADYFGLPSTEGVVVSQVLEDGPGKKAGMKDGDVILSVDGKKIKDTSALLNIVGNTPVGKTIPIEVLREKKNLTLYATIAKRPNLDEKAEATEGGATETPEGETKWRGLSIQEMPAGYGRRFGTEETEGVVINSVDPESPAADTGLQRGDVITGINNEPVKNRADFTAATKKVKGDCLIRTTRGLIVLKEKRE